MIVNWIPQLKPSEWPEDAVGSMDPKILQAAVDLRLESGIAMTPSPVFEGHVRQTGKSRHSINGGKRLSDATDFFVRSDIASVYQMIRSIPRVPAIRGWGVYFDTKPSVMFHIDCRPDGLEWLRVNREYIYASVDPSRYYRELAHQMELLK